MIYRWTSEKFSFSGDGGWWLVVGGGELRLQQVGKGRYFASSGRMYKGGSTQAGCIGWDGMGWDDGGVGRGF